MTTVGIIGAGHIGSTLAEALSAHGYDVVISNSRGPETLAPLVERLGDRVRAATADEAAEAGEWVVVTVPLKNVADIPAAPLAGKIVVDTNNYYWERDGRIAVLEEKQTTTTQLVQDHFAGAKVVKGFNHIPSAEILSDAAEAGAPDRRALVAASDHPEATAFLTALYDELGFDTVALEVDESWRIERDQPGYGIRLTADQLREKLAAAER
ncbi:NAD(P)-binding domain-containing protein [Microbacterium chocolatum]|uniref:NADPH-dependent F420 reductase n=1 Tax=Microbacterium aurantiacum TaxID=162393 RepID=UPI00338E8BB6